MEKYSIAAIVLAAGLSRRMGRPKMLLPWGETTVIGRVVQTLLKIPFADIVVVTGGSREEVTSAVRDFPVRTIYNPRFEAEGMLSTFQTGLASIDNPLIHAALLVLGDQPQIEHDVVQAIIKTYMKFESDIVVPSFQHRRGHPWLLGRVRWPEIMTLQAPVTLRDFLNRRADQIQYLVVQSDSVIQDLDTPDDYIRFAPAHS
jgi:molybdenum cofactor cytidylyltransferase